MYLTNYIIYNLKLIIKPSHLILIFTLRLGICQTLFLNNQHLPTAQCIRYPGIHIDPWLTSLPHIKNKVLSFNNRLRLLYSLLTSKIIKLLNKLLIYKLLLRPIWTCGIQIWGPLKISNTNRIQRFQSKILRIISNEPYYVSNKSLHSDLKISTATDLAKLHYKRFNNRLNHHPNPLISQLASTTIPYNPQKRLKRQWCRDLLIWIYNTYVQLCIMQT